MDLLRVNYLAVSSCYFSSFCKYSYTDGVFYCFIYKTFNVDMSSVLAIVLLDIKDFSGAVSPSVNIFKQYYLTYTPAFITSRYFLPGVARSYIKGSK